MKQTISMLTGLERLFYIFIKDNNNLTSLENLYLFYGKDDAYARRVIKRLILKKLITKIIPKERGRKMERYYKIKKYIPDR